MVSAVYGQNIYSPYSVFGVGDLQGMDLVHNTAMGGVGISTANPFHLNNKNPALLPQNRVVVFETAVTIEQKTLSTTDLSQKNFTGGLGYIAFGFPVIRDAWTISAGLMPYSIVNYETRDLGFVPGTSTGLGTTFDGGGGISQAYIATGVQLLKNFSLGIRAAYLFGSIREETVFNVADTRYLTAAISRNSFSDVTVGFGAAYSIELTENLKYINFGVTYDLGGDQNVTRLERLERRDQSNDRISPDNEPPYLVTDDLKGSVSFPSSLGLGVAFEKRLKWTVAADFTISPWSEYRNFEGESEGLNDRTEFAVGGSYIPDAFSVNNFLKRLTYMAGLNYQKTPYLANNEEIEDFGINFGITFPLRNLSRLSLAFELGERGMTDNDLIKERYFRAYMGITVNDNKWFIRRKFD
jgi:hypothetical protein